MAAQTFPYAIVGGGLAAASAVKGIREIEKSAPILLLGREKDFPYDRPPLSKKLWFGGKKVEEIFLEDQDFYGNQGVEFKPGTEVVALDPVQKELRDRQGVTYRFEKLLLATGGVPRLLGIPGGTAEGVCYYRYLDDYRRMRAEAAPGKSAVVIGGGFIGSEMAAALNINQLDVTMIFPESYLVQRVFPENLGRALQNEFIQRGVSIFSGDVPVSFERENGKFVTRTRSGHRIESDLLIVGVGIQPSVELAEGAGLKTGDGIIVNERLQSSNPEIYAAGDNANFPYLVLGKQTRVEHWDNAIAQGKQAGRNMAGAGESYAHMPYFFSDLFQFGYEAVGEIDSRLETVCDWQKENETGVIYYTQGGRLRGAMMCNVWNKVDWARDLIRRGEQVTPEQLPKVA